MTRFAPILCAALVACTQPPSESETSQGLSDAVRLERATLIRDSAAEMGLHNAALLGGIAISETGLAHCWEEAQFACMGPPSPSCGDGPIIAGAADGPCSAMQGGLGMFQFDAGTYADTVSTYTDAILTVEGNTAQAVAFVESKVELDVDGVSDWMAAMAWLDSIPLVAGEPLTEEWSHLIACRYNGCCSASATCDSRANGYRDNAIAIRDELGDAFWDTNDLCALADDGVIDDRSPCYLAGGEPRFWARASGGIDDDHETTMTTAAAAPANFARWLLVPSRATTYEIAAHVGGLGGTEPQATYTVVHAGETSTVTVDQTAFDDGDGYVVLGEFELAGDGTEYVELGDNTGTAGNTLAFDAVRVTALDGGGPGGDGGCCGVGAGGGAGGPGVLALALALLLSRSRRGSGTTRSHPTPRS